jgi:N-acetylmuramoyl-L-alanine amidase
LKLRVWLALLGCLFGHALCAQTICIDPGHPSENGVGTHGKHISEVDAAWRVALALRENLQAKGYKVVMTKTARDEKVTNEMRAETANTAQADLMIRLHCDAGAKSGFASYYPGKKGRVGSVSGPSAAVISASRRAAMVFHPAVVSVLRGKLGDRGVHTEAATMIGSKQGALTGSIYSKVPVILVEMAVLQNPHDDLFISRREGQALLARAITAGIEAAIPRRT